MAKKQFPRPPAKRKPDRLKPRMDKAEPEKVKIDPLNPPPPETGTGGGTSGDESQAG
jgi:hypothetical protein